MTAKVTRKTSKVTRAILDELLAVPVTTAAALISVSPPTLRTMVRRGELVGREIGEGRKQRTLIVSCDSLKAWISGQGANHGR